MANRKISDLTALTAPASGDYLPIVDISEAAAADKNKRITIEELFRGVPLGTAAAPAIAIEGDENTGIYSPGADQLAISTAGTGRLFVTGSGVGVNAPPALSQLSIGNQTSFGLSIQNPAGQVSSIYFTRSSNASDGRAWIQADAEPTGFMAFGAGGSERLRITSAGNVGIGTSSPSQNLHVNSGGNTVLLISSSFSGSVETAVRVDTVGDTSRANIYFSKSGTTRGSILYHHNATGASERLQLSPAGATGLNVLGSGNVGIGTTSPAGALHVLGATNGGQLKVDNAGAQYTGIDILNNGTRHAVVEFDNTASVLNVSSIKAGSSTAFVTSNVERARIDSVGRLLVGTSSSFNVGVASFGVHQFSSGNVSNQGILIENGVAGGGHARVQFVKNRGGSSGSAAIVANNDTLGALYFNGADGVDSESTGAFILAQVDGTPGTNDMPGRLVFATTADGAATSTERMRIDSSGRLLVGTSSARSNFFNTTASAGLQVEGTTSSNAHISVTVNATNDTPQISLNRSRANTIGSNTIVQSGDIVGGISFQGNDGSEFVQLAALTGEVDGTPGANDMPGRLVFSTTADGAATPTERMRITSAGNVGIGTAAPSIVTPYASVVDIRGTTTDQNWGGAIRLASNNGTTVNSTLFASSTGLFLYNTLAANVVFGTNNTERARIDASGRLLVGTSNSTDNTRLNAKVAVVGTGGGQYPGIAVTGYTGTSAEVAPFIDLNRSRGTTDGSYTEVGNNDVLGYIVFRGSDGVKWSDGANISAVADGDWTTSGDTSDSPGRLVFSTTADGADLPTERMRIDSSGRLLVGTSALVQGRVNVDGSIYLSDANSNGQGLSIYEESATVAASGTSSAFFFDRHGGGLCQITVQRTNNYLIQSSALYFVVGRGAGGPPAMTQIVNWTTGQSGVTAPTVNATTGQFTITNNDANEVRIFIHYFFNSMFS